MSFHLTHGEDYDITKLIPIRKITFIERMMLRISFPYYVFRLLKNLSAVKQDINPLHSGNRSLSGNKVIGTSSDLMFLDVKAAAKKQNVTINDLITSSLATALKEYFELKGDKTTSKVNIVIPANIRFSHYESIKTLKLENKFAPVPLIIPI
jgi:hypothetical protein